MSKTTRKEMSSYRNLGENICYDDEGRPYTALVIHFELHAEDYVRIDMRNLTKINPEIQGEYIEKACREQLAKDGYDIPPEGLSGLTELEVIIRAKKKGVQQ